MRKVVNLALVLGLCSAVQAGSLYVVQSDMAFIKKEANNDADVVSHLNKQDVFEGDEVISADGATWVSHASGFVSTKSLLKEDQLPRFLEYPEVDKSKYAIALITYKAGVVQSLLKVKMLLQNEKNLYLEKRQTAYVVYLVNFASQKDAQNKLKQIKKDFPTANVEYIKYVPAGFVVEQPVVPVAPVAKETPVVTQTPVAKEVPVEVTQPTIQPIKQEVEKVASEPVVQKAEPKAEKKSKRKSIKELLGKKDESKKEEPAKESALPKEPVLVLPFVQPEPAKVENVTPIVKEPVAPIAVQEEKKAPIIVTPVEPTKAHIQEEKVEPKETVKLPSFMNNKDAQKEPEPKLPTELKMAKDAVMVVPSITKTETAQETPKKSVKSVQTITRAEEKKVEKKAEVKEPEKKTIDNLIENLLMSY